MGVYRILKKWGKLREKQNILKGHFSGILASTNYNTTPIHHVIYGILDNTLFGKADFKKALYV